MIISDKLAALHDKAGDDWEEWDEKRLDKVHQIGWIYLPLLIGFLERLPCICSVPVMATEITAAGQTTSARNTWAQSECERCHLLRDIEKEIDKVLI